MNDFDQQVAVVTGGSSGIGLATAHEFISRGARVVITGRRQESLDSALATLGENAAASRTDVSAGDEMDQLFTDVAEQFGRLDHVVANAASGHHSTLGSITEEEFDQTFDINVRGVLHSVQKALLYMKQGGSITIIGSTASIHPPYGMGLYGGAKAAIRTFLVSWIQDTRGSGVRMNVVSPGAVDTESLRAALGKAFGADGVDKQVEAMGDGSPIGRIAATSEIAKAIAFIASDDASFIHGVEMFVDGGLAQV